MVDSELLARIPVAIGELTFGMAKNPRFFDLTRANTPVGAADLGIHKLAAKHKGAVVHSRIISKLPAWRQNDRT